MPSFVSSSYKIEILCGQGLNVHHSYMNKTSLLTCLNLLVHVVPCSK